MKRVLAILLTIVLLISVVTTTIITANATNANVSTTSGIRNGDYTYEVSKDNTAIITVYWGSDSNLIIPSSLDGYRVTMIRDNLFSDKQSLVSVTVPSTVTTIGEYAFANNYNLESVTLPDSITSIGDHAFYYCTSLTKVNIPNKLTEISDSLFEDCTSLSDITIPDSVTTIGSAAFLGTAIKEISLPEGLTVLGDAAFMNCTELTSIVVPENVTYLGYSAFSRCTKLNSVKLPNDLSIIYPRTFQYCSELTTINVPDNLTEIHDFAFDECTNLADFPLPASLIEIGDSIFRGTKLLYNIPISDDGIYIDNHLYYTSNSTENYTIRPGTLCVSGYSIGYAIKELTIPASVTSFSANAFEYCDELTNVYYEGSESQWSEINIGYGNDYLLEANIYCDHSIIPLEKLEKKENLKADTEVKTDVEVSLQSDFSFDIPDNIPFIGGGELSVDLSFIPISAQLEGNKLRIGVGCKDITNVDDNTWCNYKNYINNYKDDLKKAKNTLIDASKKGIASAGMEPKDPKFDVGVYGYYEATIIDGKIGEHAGLVNLIITGKAEQEWQTFVFSVPVVLKVKGEIGVDADIALRFNVENNDLYFDSDIELTLPKITVSAGIGIAYIADLSVYGQAENTINLYNNPKYITAVLKGEVGVSAKVFMVEGSVPILKSPDGWTYYDSRNKNTASTSANPFNQKLTEKDFAINRSYLDKQTDWLQYNTLDKIPLASVGSSEVTTLQSNIYTNALPVLIATDDTIMMVWTQDITSRTDGNHTAIVYSLYDMSSKQWSSPTIIEDDKTADFNPCAATDGKNIYVSWVDTNTTFNGEINLEKIASSCEISIAKYDIASDKFTTKSLTNNNTIDTLPSLSVVNGKATVAWKNNSNNNSIDFSGKDSIYYAIEDNNGNYNVKQYVSLNSPIYRVVTDGKHIAYTSDLDGTLDTYEDIEVYYGSIFETPKRITNNTSVESNLQTSIINGDSYITYLSDGVIYSIDNNTQTALTKSDNYISGTYQFVSDESTTKLLVTENLNNSSTIYNYSLNENYLWSNPVELLNSDSYIRGVTSIIDNSGAIQTAFLETGVDIGEETITESCSLCTATLKEKHDIRINSIDYDTEDIIPGKEMKIEASITNMGTVTEKYFEIDFSDNTSGCGMHTYRELEIKSGETKTLDISIDVPQDLNELHNNEVEILLEYDIDENQSDNTFEFNYGYTNLQLSTGVIKAGENAGIVLNINNNTPVSTSAKLSVKANNLNGDTLAMFELEDLSAFSVSQYLIDSTKISEYSNTCDTLYFEITADKDEIAVADNSDFVYIRFITETLLGDIDGDGDITIIDATKLQQHLANKNLLPESALSVADTDKDGSLAIMDATLIQRFVAKIITAF